MNILKIFESIAKDEVARIGIGLGDDDTHNLKIFNSALQLIKSTHTEMFIFGKSPSIQKLAAVYKDKEYKSALNLIRCESPEIEILDWLKDEKLNAVVRGGISSTEFLKQIGKKFKVSLINRLALLETYDGYQFFYGPVGIDECNSLEKKILFIKQALKLLNSLKITPKISVLSGGRKSDIGRDSKVDETINIALNVVENLKREFPTLDIRHSEILIEKAIEDKCNLILAPEGISGNLIYRTLVHLGGGKAYGAVYMDLEKPIIDTSRVGNLSEIQGGFLLALAMINFQPKPHNDSF